MHYLLSLASILCLMVVLLFGLLDVVRELLTRDFFGAPSLPSEPTEQPRASEREADSHSASPLS